MVCVQASVVSDQRSLNGRTSLVVVDHERHAY